MIIKYYKKVCNNGCDGMNEKAIQQIVSELDVNATVKVFRDLMLQKMMEFLNYHRL